MHSLLPRRPLVSPSGSILINQRTNCICIKSHSHTDIGRPILCFPILQVHFFHHTPSWQTTQPSLLGEREGQAVKNVNFKRRAHHHHPSCRPVIKDKSPSCANNRRLPMAASVQHLLCQLLNSQTFSFGNHETAQAWYWCIFIHEVIFCDFI